MGDVVRKSIWKENEYERYLGDFSKNKKKLATLRYVEHAKKQAGVVSNEDLKLVYNSICSVPENATDNDIKNYLNSVCGIDGIGIRIAICMLSRLRSREFSPFDRFILAGLQRDEVITSTEHEILNKANIHTFPPLYINKIVRKWKQKINDGHTPSRIDKQWVKLGKQK